MEAMDRESARGGVITLGSEHDGQWTSEILPQRINAREDKRCDPIY